MAQLVKFEAEDGSVMWVETTIPSAKGAEIGLVADEGGIAKAAAKLEDSLASVRGSAVALLSVVNDLKSRTDAVALDEVSLDLALSFGVEGGVVVAKGSAKAEAAVTLTWRAPE
jgi:hypothetical protein